MATLKDIAREAGVSACTVSRYLNGKLAVRPETARRIDEAVAALDYRKNYLAVALKTHTSRMVAVVLPAIKSIFLADVVENLTRTLEEAGYHVAIFTTENRIQREKEIADRLPSLGVAGAVFVTLPMDYRDGTHIQRLEEQGISTLMLNRFFEPGVFTSVSTDLFSGARDAVSAMLRSGCRRPALVAGSPEQPQSRQYVDAFREALGRTRRDPPGEWIRYCRYEPEEMSRATRELLRQGADGFLCITDYLALVARQTIREMGLRVPEDVALVGSEDTESSGLLGLSTIGSRPAELGHRGAELLLERLQGGEPGRFVLVKPGFQIRSSLGPVRRPPRDSLSRTQ